MVHLARPSRRLLLVHAHPDDETLTTGVTMARYAQEGVQVVLVTCTLGEEGEVLLADKAHLAAAHQDALGPHRLEELTAAMACLGVADHRQLGAVGRYRDSGMVGTEANTRADNFVQADLGEAATELVRVIREVQPQVVITYDDFGGYGHPDHIQAHRVTTYAVSLAAVPSFRPDIGPEPWQVSKVYWPALPREVTTQALARIPAEQLTQFVGDADLADLPFLVDDEFVTTRIDGRPMLDRKIAAMRAHASQIDMESPFFAMSAVAGPDALGYEHYRLAAGSLGAADDDGFEDDLFAGLE
ncbi:MAG: N-acetyl-1-D-myo-inositol-2-amino-2-deoxy-alpha-D-glucopyranoside deacetylase [Actinobacteria bacterium]|nr:N-acetyl-1-D-myo-inositol-2-amino-2-deoxy-alpha-D-glucopyranoside deacetylase [Actinomycetota bacterium]